MKPQEQLGRATGACCRPGQHDRSVTSSILIAPDIFRLANEFDFKLFSNARMQRSVTSLNGTLFSMVESGAEAEVVDRITPTRRAEFPTAYYG